jgi:hydrogenase maturation protein HypF
LAENGRRGPVIGVAWDGTGYGDDGSVWGGEILVADLAGFERVGRIRPVALPGGDAAIREPWRMAVAHLMAAGLATSRVPNAGRPTVEAMIREGVNSVPTSSAGRLFDAVASLVGLSDVATYEAARWSSKRVSSDESLRSGGRRPLIDIDAGPLVAAVVEDVIAA